MCISRGSNAAPAEKRRKMPRRIHRSLPQLKLDLDLDAGGDLEVHQGLDRLLGGGDDVDEALVGAALELLTAVLVLVDGAQDGDDLGLGGRRAGW